ncbi:MAG: transporter substrate-binding domain-containing protein [Anaeroplasmataceae bacterium]
MNLKKLVVSVVVVFLGLFALTGCSSNEDKLYVATNAEFPPFEYKVGNEFKGIDMDIITGFAKHIGKKVEIVDMDFDAIIPSVKSGKSDVGIAGLTYDETRAESVAFTDYYFDACQKVIVKNDSPLAKITDKDELIKALEGKKIGFQRGTTAQFYVEGSDDWGFTGIKDAEAMAFDTGALAISKLEVNAIDAVIIDELPANKLIHNSNDSKKELSILKPVLTSESYAAVVKIGNTQLQTQLNEYIALIKENGELKAIIENYESLAE